jgi:hypothetical protein
MLIELSIIRWIGHFKNRGFNAQPPRPRLRVTDFPTQCTVLLSAHTKNIAKIITMEYVFNLSNPYEYHIEKALDLLNRELIPNYKALRAGLKYTTLSRRHRGITTSRAKVNSKYQQCLTIT